MDLMRKQEHAISSILRDYERNRGEYRNITEQLRRAMDSADANMISRLQQKEEELESENERLRRSLEEMKEKCEELEYQLNLTRTPALQNLCEKIDRLS